MKAVFLSAEKESAHSIESRSINEQKSVAKAENDKQKSEEKFIEIRENKPEVLTQEKGR